MRPTVLLFDVDGTLVTTGGVGRRALERAFLKSFGRQDSCAFRLDGMTDRAIVRRALAALGREGTATEIDQLLAVYLELLAEEVASASAEVYRIHAGIEDALDIASAASACAVGLGTGNVREGARLKLSRVRLDGCFAFGGFGCDHEDRAELIRIGARRGVERLGVASSECRVVVIGDTPKDIEAARAVGAESIGVGTGSFSPGELQAHGATYAFRDLEAPGALDALLGNAGRASGE